MARKKKSAKKPIEQYDHKGKKRVNNPPVGLVTPETDKETGKKTYAYDPHIDPSLQWAGKTEHTSFEVPTVSLHVHERIDPRTIIEAVRKTNDQKFEKLSLFATPEENPPLREAIRFENSKSIEPIFDQDYPIRSTRDMQTWFTGKPCEHTQKSHINMCVFDSTWEASEAFELDRHPNIKAWVKNDHLGFEILYIFDGIVRKYRPDFIIQLKTGNFLILETKGKETLRDKTKHRFLNEWVKAVNEHGGFGNWKQAVSRDPADVKMIIEDTL